MYRKKTESCKKNKEQNKKEIINGYKKLQKWLCYKKKSTTNFTILKLPKRTHNKPKAINNAIGVSRSSVSKTIASNKYVRRVEINLNKP